MKPAVYTKGNRILISFSKLILKIYLDSGQLYVSPSNNAAFRELDYKNIKVSHFNKRFSRPENKKRPKSKVAYFFLPFSTNPKYVFGIDVSLTDHRLFFLAWHYRNYNSFRGKPFWKASFFINPYSKNREWYEEDLSQPKYEWPINPNTEEPTCQKKITETINQ